MKPAFNRTSAVLFLMAVPAFAFQEVKPEAQASAALTIYNQDFAVVKQPLPLHLKSGENETNYSEVTEQVEPESVILRDPSEKHPIQILEQNYRFETASQSLLLNLFEGKTIDFKVQHQDGSSEMVQGKIIRSGFVDRVTVARRYGQQYYNASNQQYEQPLIEVNGKLQFSLPGTPLFPSLPIDVLLKPSLNWKIGSTQNADFTAELSYVTGGMTWQADYNVIAPTQGDMLDMLGWVTIDNHSGKQFDNASVKLMAGEVSKINPNQPRNGAGMGGAVDRLQIYGRLASPAVTEKTFDDYHLYSLARQVTLRNRETKQVEMLRANKIPAKRVYVYDGFRMDPQYQNQSMEYIRRQRDFGTSNNTKVWIMEEFKNSKENNLGMALPKGRMRFYRRDEGGQLEFIGENDIDHTPKDEMVRVYTGNAFDITGERKRLDFRLTGNNDSADESFEIHLRNHKKEAVQVKVVEHMYRGYTWTMTSNSQNFTKKDSETIEFLLDIPPDGEQKILYSVHYSW